MNCHHEFPGLGCCVTPHPVSDVSSFKFKVSSSLVNLKLETLNSKLSFHTDHLFNLGDDLNEVFLVLHHRFD